MIFAPSEFEIKEGFFYEDNFWGIHHTAWDGPFVVFRAECEIFALKPGMVWPEGSWAISKLFGNEVARSLAIISLILAAFALVVGGVGLLVNQAWWRPVVVGVASFSSLVFILFWNGRMQNLDGQGLVGILIDLAVLIAVLIFRWPATE